MRILLAIDGSASADLACRVVGSTHWPAGSFVRVVAAVPGTPWALDLGDASRQHEPMQRARLALDEAERLLGGPGRRVETMVLEGRPASTIVEEADAFDADLIVVGSRGHGPWESRVLGSVSAEVVDHAPCPVLVVRTPDLEPIVFADDGSEHARRAEALLAHWPRLPGATVTVVTVIAPRTYWPALPGDAGSVALETYAADMEHARRDAEVEASQAARRLCDAGFDARPELRGGDPASVLVDAAKRHAAGLIVMGTRGHGGIARLLIGSVARNVLLHAPCSVLIARPTRRRVPKVEAAARLAGAAL